VGRTCTVFASDGDVFSHRRAVVLLMPISSEAPANHQMVSQCHSVVEVGYSYNSVTNKLPQSSFGIRCHRASPRPVVFLGPPFAKTSGPNFRVS
jgi:hypothetical protein